MRTLLLAALVGLALAPLAVPTAEATRCAFPVEELQSPVCRAVLLGICVLGSTPATSAKACLPRLP